MADKIGTDEYGEILIYQTDDGQTNIEVKIEDDTVWLTQRLKEYMIKGFTIDDERLKGNGGGNYWKELLDRIRDIRSSEKVLYRQVLERI